MIHQNNMIIFHSDAHSFAAFAVVGTAAPANVDPTDAVPVELMPPSMIRKVPFLDLTKTRPIKLKKLFLIFA